MEHQENKPELEQSNTTEPSGPKTPHDIVEKQIRNFDYHVTAEDMDNMIITDEPTVHDKEAADKEAGSLDKDRAGTSYDILDETS